MSRYEITKVYVIREKSTGKLIKFSSGKCGWMSSAAAKNAFNLHMKSHFGKTYMDDTKGLFDTQDEFTLEVIE